MVAIIHTVAFSGIDVLDIEVQVQIAAGLPAFTIVGLPDKAVGESRERVRAALHAMGLSLPPKRVTVNLAPADVMKEGSHYDLPIALCVLGAMEVLPREELAGYCALGELGLDAKIRTVNGVLPAAIHAATKDLRLICPEACGAEAAWAGDALEILAPQNLLQLINHFKGTQVLSPPKANFSPEMAGFEAGGLMPCLSTIKGQALPKRALEIAAAGGHTLLMSGPPGSGKSMLARCLPSILPPLSAKEALEISLIHSLAGSLPEGGLMRTRPFRDPHHSATMASLIGGGTRVQPGEISLAHGGVLFLDELPEFQRAVLDSLRQPLETGQAVIARANQHVSYPARFQLIAAMNPCRCGYISDPARACSKAPRCAEDYAGRISGPFLDRIDLQVEVPAVSYTELLAPAEASETSAVVAVRVAAARTRQFERFATLNVDEVQKTNATIPTQALENMIELSPEAKALMVEAAAKFHLSARGVHRLMRTARTIQDLAVENHIFVQKTAVAEALSYRLLTHRYA